PLEQQVELEGIDIRDTERVRYERARRRAAPRPHRNAAVLRRLDDVVDDQEVARVAGVRDYLQLVVEPLVDRLREGVAVALPRPRPRQMHEQVVVRRELGGARVLRKEV